MFGYRLLFAFAKGEDKKSHLEELIERVGWHELMEIGATILVAILGGWLFKRLVLTRFEKMAKRTDNDVDDRLVRFISRFYKGLIAFAVLIVVLQILRVRLTPLLAGAGLLGIGVAYAAKDVIGNFLAGVFLLIDQPIKLGDRILIERIGRDWGSWGDVVNIGLRTTTVKNTDGVYVTYPNAKLAESIIRNFSPTAAPVRFRTRILVAYEEDLEKALGIMEQVARDDPKVLAEPKPAALVRGLYNPSDSLTQDGALLELRCFVDDIRVRTRLRSSLLLGVKKELDKAGISLVGGTELET